MVFAGLDEIDWASMTHAYGTADEVPHLVVGLTSEDAAVREEALDGFYGAVHHQGDVYDCTVAAVPFLVEVALCRTVAERGDVLELIASIGGVSGGRIHPDFGETADPYGVLPRRAMARTMLTDRLADLLGLLDDEDVGVRAHVPEVLLACRGGRGEVLPALRARFEGESDPEVRAALLQALDVAVRHSDVGERGAMVRWFTEQAARTDDPAGQLRALAALAAADGPAAAEAVEAALLAVERLYESAPEAAVPDPDEPVTAPTTLVGAVRLLNADVRLPWAADAVRDLDQALGSRRAERTALADGLLRMSAGEMRAVGVYLADGIVSRWRGDHGGLIHAVADQLDAPEPRVRDAAASFLDSAGPLAAPAADVLAAFLPPPDGTEENPRTRTAMRVLARLGDPRAVPAVRHALETDEHTLNFGSLLRGILPQMTRPVPLLLASLRRLYAAAVDQGGWDGRIDGLVFVLGDLGEAAADAVPDLVAVLDTNMAVHQTTPTNRAETTRHRNAQWAIRAALVALGRVGPIARDSAPAVDRLLESEAMGLRIEAARTIWRTTGSPDAALALLPALLAPGDEDHHRQRDGADLAADLGPVGTAMRDELAALANTNDPYGWTDLAAGTALWHTTGEREPAVSALLTAVANNRRCLRQAVDCFADMGPLARSSLPLIEAELAAEERHTYDGQISDSHAIADDIALLAACEHARERITGRTA